MCPPSNSGRWGAASRAETGLSLHAATHMQATSGRKTRRDLSMGLPTLPKGRKRAWTRAGQFRSGTLFPPRTPTCSEPPSLGCFCSVTFPVMLGECRTIQLTNLALLLSPHDIRLGVIQRRRERLCVALRKRVSAKIHRPSLDGRSGGWLRRNGRARATAATRRGRSQCAQSPRWIRCGQWSMRLSEWLAMQVCRKELH